MRVILLSLILVVPASAKPRRPPQAPACHRPPQAPPVCPAPAPESDAEDRQWRAEGWERDAQGRWYRWVTPAAPGTYAPAAAPAYHYYVPPVRYAPAFGGGGGWSGGC